MSKNTVLIDKGNPAVLQPEVPQEASARAQADARLRENSSNNPIYIVTVEDPTVKLKCRTFIAVKINQEANCLDVIGYEIKKTETKALNNVREVLDNVIKGKLVQLSNIKFPWTRVINIENKTFNKG